MQCYRRVGRELGRWSTINGALEKGVRRDLQSLTLAFIKSSTGYCGLSLRNSPHALQSRQWDVSSLLSSLECLQSLALGRSHHLIGCFSIPCCHFEDIIDCFPSRWGQGKHNKHHHYSHNFVFLSRTEHTFRICMNTLFFRYCVHVRVAFAIQFDGEALTLLCATMNSQRPLLAINRTVFCELGGSHLEINHPSVNHGHKTMAYIPIFSSSPNAHGY